MSDVPERVYTPWGVDYIRIDLHEQQAQEIERLKREVEVLRLYGNNDCTRMADAALEAKK